MALAEQRADDEEVDENGGDDEDEADGEEGVGGQGRPHQDR